MSDELDTSICEVFLADAKKISKALGEGLLALMDKPSDQERATSLMRLAHSLKGASSSMLTAEDVKELAPLAEMATALDACLNAARSGRIVLNRRNADEFLEGAALVSALGELAPADMKKWLAEHAAPLHGLSVRFSAIEKGQPASDLPPEKPAAAPVPEQPPQRDAPPVSQALPGELSDSSLLGLFRVESETQAQLLAEGFMKLEADPDSSAETLVVLMRAAHSLKGAARIIQLDDVVTLAHSMESCLVAAMEGRVSLEGSHFDILLEGADLVKELSKLEESELAPFVAREKSRFLELAAAYDTIKGGADAPPSKQPERPMEPQPPKAQEPAPSPAPAAETPAPPLASPAKQHTQEEPSAKNAFVRVGTDKLSKLLSLAGESIVDAKKMRALETQLLSLKGKFAGLAGSRELAGFDQAGMDASREACDALYGDINSFYTNLSDFLLKMDNFSSSLYNEVFDCRIRPFEDGVGGFPRMVRDIAKRLGKKVRLEISGRRTDVDRDILEKLEAPLNHILRNALDHGLETPEERLKAGKPESGLIELVAYHWAGALNIKVIDDGRGIDIAEVRRRIAAKALATEEMLKGMTDAEVLEFLFLPGFSTARAITEISGRGVGLDVVQSMAQEVRGSVRIETKLGKGTTFHLQLPVTLSLIPALVTLIGEETYAFPLVRVERLLRVSRDMIHSIGSHQFISHDGRNIGLVSARELLGLPVRELDEPEIPLVVVSDRNSQYAIVVDSIAGEREIVVHPLDERLGKISYINAASLTDEGAPLLILDVDDMLRSIDTLLKGGSLHRIRSSESRRRDRKRVLVADDSLTVRELERNLLANHGYDVDVAVDGAEAWNSIRLGEYDLVVTDVDMPRMNGFELVEKLKANERLKALPVVIVSYKDREEDRLRGLEVGADYYLTKGSFHDNSFIQAVNDLTGGSLK